MVLNKNTILLLLLISLSNIAISQSQNIKFKTLDASKGLKTNIINDVALDQHGRLLLGTDNGLEIFDGNTFEIHKDSNLKKQILALHKDKNEMLWIGTTTGAFSINKNGTLTKVNISPNDKDHKTNFISECQYGVVAIVSNRLFLKNNDIWTPLVNFPDSLMKRSRRKVYCDNNHIYFILDDRFISYDFKKEIKKYNFPKITSLTTSTDGKLYISNSSGKLFNFDITANKASFIAKLPSKLNQNGVAPFVLDLIMISNDEIGIGTEDDGYITYNLKTKKLNTYYQDEVAELGIANNQAQSLFKDSKGRIYIKCLYGGISFYEPQKYFPIHIKAFQDKRGDIFSTYINCMLKSPDEKKIYIGTTDRLITYHLQSKTCEFKRFLFSDSTNTNYALGIKSMALDHTGNFWLGTFRGGLLRYNPKNEVITFYNRHNPKSKTFIGSNYIHFLTILSDKNIWVGTNGGLYVINPMTNLPIKFPASSPISKLPTSRVRTITEDPQGNIWVGYQSKGIYKINPSTNEIDSFNKNNGFPDNLCFFSAHDRKGNSYVSYDGGVAVITNHKVKTLDQSNGLKYRLTENIFIDNNDQVWLCNNTQLIKYNTDNNQFTYFDDKYGIPKYSFITNSMVKIGDEVHIGTEKGIFIVNPGALEKIENDYSIIISNVRYSAQDLSLFTDPKLKLNDVKDISFLFNTINLNGVENMEYKYMLEGYDKDWQNTNKDLEIKYNDLPYGNFVFKVKGSADGKIWKEANFVVSITINKPFYLKNWFITLTSLFTIVFSYLLFRKNYLDKKKKNELKAKLTDLEIKAIRAQMNPHFVFNALNSIQYFNYSGEVDKANEYLSDFAKLMRLVLQQSKDGLISLYDEAELLKLYVKIEALKFEKDFTFSVTIDENITDPEHIIMPSMIIQPFAENAIKHGLTPQKGFKFLHIKFNLVDNELKCDIIDNGIGINASKELKTDTTLNIPHQSMGMDLVHRRLEMYNVGDGRKATINVNENPPNGGTHVTIFLPII